MILLDSKRLTIKKVLRCLVETTIKLLNQPINTIIETINLIVMFVADFGNFSFLIGIQYTSSISNMIFHTKNACTSHSTTPHPFHRISTKVVLVGVTQFMTFTICWSFRWSANDMVLVICNIGKNDAKLDKIK